MRVNDSVSLPCLGDVLTVLVLLFSVEDDEETLEKEESMEQKDGNDHEAELNDLQKMGELPLEELLKMYQNSEGMLSRILSVRASFCHSPGILHAESEESEAEEEASEEEAGKSDSKDAMV